MKDRRFSLIILLVLAGAFGLGVLELFQLRFEAGDVYPPYSTLRADPLGAGAFYESLQRMPGISVSRDFRPTDEMPDGRGVAYLHLAGNREEWDEVPDDLFRGIETFVKAGGRLVIALSPEPAKPHQSRFAKEDEADKKADDKKKDDLKAKHPSKKKKKILDEGEPSQHWVSLVGRWGIGFDLKDMSRGEGDAYAPLTVENPDEPSLPESMKWHSGVIITKLDKSWRVIYERGADPVLVERKMGAGTVVFSTDSYFMSNEAMQKDRHAELLAWIVGPAKEVMFDEAHLGIVNNPGLAVLLRKYRLHGLIAGFLLLAGLFIWKNSLGFGPAREEAEAGHFVAGKDSAAGFVNLLRHHIKPQDLLKTCVTEWRKSLPKGQFSENRMARVEAFLQTENSLPPKQRNPVRSYQTICAILKIKSEPPISAAKADANPKTI